MQPLRLKITGEFWDALLYSGRLYLWDFENCLRIYDWDRLIESVAENSAAITCAFARSDLLYRVRDERVLITDPLVSNALSSSFAEAAQRTLEFSLSDLAFAKVGEQDSPTSEQHDDAVIHKNRLFLLTQNGLFAADLLRRRKHAVKKNAERHWDGVALGLDARLGWLALAAGAEGVFQLYVGGDGYDRPEPENLSNRHCTFVNWAYSSIYASSAVSGGTMLGFTWTKVGDARYRHNARDRDRVFAGAFDDNDIRARANLPSEKLRLSWAADDKIYFAMHGTIDVCRFTQKYLDDDLNRAFQTLGDVPIKLTGSLLAATGSLFGTIIETSGGLVIVLSDDSVVLVSQPPVRWRVFRRSKQYENQLHMIFDDHLEILSFNQDYAVDQKTKIAGSMYRKPRAFSPPRQ
jgi:hypothetical protein